REAIPGGDNLLVPMRGRTPQPLPIEVVSAGIEGGARLRRGKAQFPGRLLGGFLPVKDAAAAEEVSSGCDSEAGESQAGPSLAQHRPEVVRSPGEKPAFRWLPLAVVAVGIRGGIEGSFR